MGFSATGVSTRGRDDKALKIFLNSECFIFSHPQVIAFLYRESTIRLTSRDNVTARFYMTFNIR
ncbi:hypothetical protein D3869_28560 (plasmid) [Azospirillum brasilense]|uniref:Uncharacterized protein n=1 Tax=Azospirillum brasilense TaxID=192 RepID=A0A4D8REZ7_AZOBR|nr:hypothetical protein D3869_28560 [Azospirillum brasilense]